MLCDLCAAVALLAWFSLTHVLFSLWCCFSSPSLSFSRFFSLLSTRSLLLAVWTPPAFFTFLPVYAGIFSILPRSVLAKGDAHAGQNDEGVDNAEGDDAATNVRQRVLQGGVEALLDGSIAPAAPASTLLAPHPLLLSKRALRKRKQAERVAQKDAFSDDNTFNARNSAHTAEPPGKRQESEALVELKRLSGVDPASASSLAAPVASSAAASAATVASAAASSSVSAVSSVPRRARRARQEE